MMDPARFSHEVCKCGHCRCLHRNGFEDCRACKTCIRYTWPGPGAHLLPNHEKRPFVR